MRRKLTENKEGEEGKEGSKKKGVGVGEPPGQGTEVWLTKEMEGTASTVDKQAICLLYAIVVLRLRVLDVVGIFQAS